ncbi:MAG: thioredoxin family protein [Desulfobacteraceae bacterium]|nr:thioredoxin family protein [Desulfobacteraceae bacterium]
MPPIKIGKAAVGLVGFDRALKEALDREIGEEEAVELLFRAVAAENYVPAGAAGLYREALRREYRRQRGERGSGPQGLSIRILGPGCVSCNRLNTLVYDIMQRLGIAADIEMVHDLDEIWRYGVLSTPALVINGEVKCAGRMPAPAQVEEWLREASV